MFFTHFQDGNPGKPGSFPKRMLLDSDYPPELIRKRAGESDQTAKKFV